jgi:hypothetical protein
MSRVDDIRSSLGAARESFDEAVTLVKRAAEMASDLEQSAAGHGWWGVEQAMSECQEKLQEASPAIGDALHAVVDAVASMAEITQEMSSDEIATRLAAVGERLGSARTATGQALESVGEARTAAGQADATTVVEMSDEAETALTTGQGLLEAATTAADTEQSEASAWGN